MSRQAKQQGRGHEARREADAGAGGAATVYLVGAGPGDIELLTMKGLRCLRNADVVISDHLVNDRFFDFMRDDAERICMGAEAGRPRPSMDEISDLMISRARQGNTVVRLQTGDPCLFGGIGKVIEALTAAGVPFEIVPGVSSAYAAAAYAGIPLTHRDHSASVAIVSGRGRAGSHIADIHWEHLARAVDTLVVMMGVGNLPAIVEQLLAHGHPPTTPIALIRQGTTPSQETLLTTLATVVDEVKRRGFKAPAIFIIGDVARLHERFNWFETKPLFGKRIVVTRPRAEASSLAGLLERYGAEALLCPVIEPAPLADYQRLDAALQRLESYDWLIFTSVHGVRYFVRRLRENNLDLRALSGTKLCAIGPKTAAELEALHLRVDLMPNEYRAESVIEAFGTQVKGVRFLLPRAEVAREVLPKTLRARGAIIDVAPAYRTIRPDASPDHHAILEALQEGSVAAVTFTSSSTVNNFLALLPAGHAKELLDTTVLASIGPITSGTLREHGLTPTLTAREYTIEGLTQELLQYFKQ